MNFREIAQIGLYVHIPFCHVKCKYCDFAVFPGLLKQIPRYLSALNTEIQIHKRKTLDSLYIGGGTPTVLEPEDWYVLMRSLHNNFSFVSNYEASVESNPESTSPEKLSAFLQTGINRLSFGLQAVQERLLKQLGRQHDFEGFVQVFRQARSMGFKNLSVDLMYGLPAQTMADWKETLERVIELSPEHISAYALSVEDKTSFHFNGIKTDPDLQADMYEMTADILEDEGYVHYEISNFARPGFECRHNLKYWRNLDCLGVGVSAAGYENGIRRKNTDRFYDYLNAMEQSCSAVVEETILSESEKVGEDLMLGLRLKEGSSFSGRAKELYGSVLDRFQSLGFLYSAGNKIQPTRLGWLLSNQMFHEFV